jgi:hypothetical protein
MKGGVGSASDISETKTLPPNNNEMREKKIETQRYAKSFASHGGGET